MANLSPSTVAINTVAHCIANALDASAGLDAVISEDLRALLRIAATEVDRVRKTNRKASLATKRSADQSGKKSKTKRAPVEETVAQLKPAKAKGRGRKAQTANGIVAH